MVRNVNLIELKTGGMDLYIDNIYKISGNV
jgi:hypothetical protein